MKANTKVFLIAAIAGVLAYRILISFKSALYTGT